MGSLKKLKVAMHMRKVYFDTNLFIYFLERHDELFDRCLPFFEWVDAGDVFAMTGDLTLAELLVKPMRINDQISIERIKSLFDERSPFELLAHNREVMELAAYVRATKQLKMPDAIHVATALKNRCAYFLTHDVQLVSRVRGIEVIDIGSVVP